MKVKATLLSLLLGCALAGCAPDDDDDGGRRRTPGLFGEATSIVLIVNPDINAGSSTDVEPGGQRGGVRVEVADTPIATQTDESGLALLIDVPTGEVELLFESGSVTVDIQRERELYDVVVAVRPDGVEHVLPPVRYPIAGDVVIAEPGDDLAEAAGEDDAIVLLRPGTYPGDVELRSAGVLLYGAWDPSDGASSVIEGDVTVLGGNTRMRGVHVDGTLTTSANGFSAGFNRLGSAAITGNSVSLIRNFFEQGSATVPSSNAVLVDNTGIP